MNSIYLAYVTCIVVFIVGWISLAIYFSIPMIRHWYVDWCWERRRVAPRPDFFRMTILPLSRRNSINFVGQVPTYADAVTTVVDVNDLTIYERIAEDARLADLPPAYIPANARSDTPYPFEGV